MNDDWQEPAPWYTGYSTHSNRSLVKAYLLSPSSSREAPTTDREGAPSPTAEDIANGMTEPWMFDKSKNNFYGLKINTRYDSPQRIPKSKPPPSPTSRIQWEEALALKTRKRREAEEKEAKTPSKRGKGGKNAGPVDLDDNIFYYIPPTAEEIAAEEAKVLAQDSALFKQQCKELQERQLAELRILDPTYDYGSPEADSHSDPESSLIVEESKNAKNKRPPSASKSVKRDFEDDTTPSVDQVKKKRTLSKVKATPQIDSEREDENENEACERLGMDIRHYRQTFRVPQKKTAKDVEQKNSKKLGAAQVSAYSSDDEVVEITPSPSKGKAVLAKNTSKGVVASTSKKAAAGRAYTQPSTDNESKSKAKAPPQPKPKPAKKAAAPRKPKAKALKATTHDEEHNNDEGDITDTGLDDILGEEVDDDDDELEDGETREESIIPDSQPTKRSAVSSTTRLQPKSFKSSNASSKSSKKELQQSKEAKEVKEPITNKKPQSKRKAMDEPEDEDEKNKPAPILSGKKLVLANGLIHYQIKRTEWKNEVSKDSKIANRSPYLFRARKKISYRSM